MRGLYIIAYHRAVPPNPTLGLTLLLLALSAFGVGLGVFGSEYIWVESTEGKVAELVWSEKSGSAMCAPVFAYEVEGKPYRHQRQVRESACGWTEGETVTLYYAAQRPAKAHTFTFFGLVPLFIGGAVGLFLAMRSVRAFRGRPKTLEEQIAELKVVALDSAPTRELIGLRGTIALRGKPLSSPMTAETCAAWEVGVHRLIGTSERVLIRRNRKVGELSLVDGDRQAILRSPADVKTVIAPQHTARNEGVDQTLEAHLAAVGVPEGSRNSRSLTFEWSEGTVSDGATAVIYAILRERDGELHLEAPEGGVCILASHQSRSPKTASA